MNETLKEQSDIVQKLSSEIQSAQSHFLLKNAVKPLSLVLSFMRNVVRLAIDNEKRLKALEKAQSGVNHAE